MIYRNMIELAIPSVEQVVKVGDTIAELPACIEQINRELRR